MKKNELTNFKAKKTADLKISVLTKKRELTLFYSKVASSGEKNLKKSQNIKRDIAQILTIIRQKELEEVKT